jgi:O-acetyl-ADP-ribose deacetylase (regulator of RNase III)
MIRIVLCEPTEVEADGVLRSVNSDLTADTATSRHLELKAGQDMVDRIQAMGELSVGGAVITPGGDLPFGFLIHVVTQSPEEPVHLEGLRAALRNGLRRAREWGLSRLVLSPLGTGAGNLEAEESASVMVPLIQDHLRDSEFPKEAIITVSSEYERDVFLRAVEAAQRQASASGN